MKESKYFQPVVTFAGVIGVIQAVVWFILSLLAVMAYRCNLYAPEYSDVNQFSATLVKFYFEGHDCPVNIVNITLGAGISLNISQLVDVDPTYLNGWMASYIAVSIFYAIASVFVLYYKTSEKSVLRYWLTGWCLTTFANLAMDLALTLQFGLDFQHLTDRLRENNLSGTLGWMTSVPGAMMAIAARGFVLWFLNLALMIYLLFDLLDWYMHKNAEKENSRTDLASNASEPIQAYNNTIPRATEQHLDEQAIVPYNYFNRQVTRPWENPRQPDYGVTRFAHEEVFEPRRPQQPQRPVVWEDSEPEDRPYRKPVNYVQRQQTERPPRQQYIEDQDEQRRTSLPPRQSTDFAHNLRNFEAGGRGQNGNRNPNERKPYAKPVRAPPPPSMPKTTPKSDSLYY